MDWLIQNKTDFKKIILFLNKYYSQIPNKKTDSQIFREEVAKAEEDNLNIFFKKFGDFEYLVAVKIKENKKSKMDSWIHIDGIFQERISLLEKGNSTHPIFSIKCVTDLYNNSCRKYDKELVLEWKKLRIFT